VGAVARDRSGGIAAATSTGGTPKKIPGRVGDSALIGCSTYADDRAGGVSVTGWGESIIRTGTARTVIERLRAGDDPETAAAFAVDELSRMVKGLGGVIVVGADGRFAAHFNTPCMARGWWTPAMDEPFLSV
jgi:beta-aspartyl-peptidase (threonine type)